MNTFPFGYKDYNDALHNGVKYTVEEAKNLKTGDKAIVLSTHDSDDNYSLENRLFEGTVTRFPDFVDIDGYPFYFNSPEWGEEEGGILLHPKTVSQPVHTCGENCTHSHHTEPEIEKQEEKKEPVIGKFKPKRKFLNFVQGRKGGIRFHDTSAYIKSEQLTGTIEDTLFKVTICDEGTINFEEVGTSHADDAMIQRFIDDIDSRDVTGYMHKYVVHKLEFADGDGMKMYLEVEYTKPIDKLFSLFDDLKLNEEPMTEEVKVSDNAQSLLDSLFGDDDVDTTKEEIESTPVEDVEPKETYAQQMMREAFENMNREKIEELSGRIEKTEKDIKKYKFDIKQNEANLKAAVDNIRVLNSRLDSLKPIDPPTGYVFFVSTENKTGITIDPNVENVVKQIAPLLKLNEEKVLEYLTKGFYTIKIAKKDDITSETISISKEIYEKINKIDVTGNIQLIKPNEFEYRGDFTWHQLVDRMIKMGFEQDPAYDKQCGSVSYQSSEDIQDRFVLTDGNGNVLPPQPNATAIAQAIGEAFATKQNPEPVVDSITHKISNESYAKCELKEIQTPSDIRSSIFNKIPNLKKMEDESELIYAVKDLVKNWPEASWNNGDGFSDFEELDLENCEVKSITPDSIVIWAGGDWQYPLCVTIKTDENRDFYVTDINDNDSNKSLDIEEIKNICSIAVVRDEKIESIITPPVKFETSNEEEIGKVVYTTTEPTTLVILDADAGKQIAQVTDDESSFSLYKGSDQHSTYGCFGFVHVMTLDEFKEYQKNHSDMLEDVAGVIGGVVLPNFTGSIRVGAVLGNDDISSNFDINDYIQHQFDDYVDVAVILPKETTVIDLNDDLSLPLAIIRDQKIDTIIK